MDSNFEQLKLNPATLAALRRLGMTRPSIVQERALPPVRLGKDTVVQARSGTGKTLVAAIAMLEWLDPRATGGPQCVVVCPTKEIADQFAAVVVSLTGVSPTGAGREAVTHAAAAKGGGDPRPARVDPDAERRRRERRERDARLHAAAAEAGAPSEWVDVDPDEFKEQRQVPLLLGMATGSDDDDDDDDDDGDGDDGPDTGRPVIDGHGQTGGLRVCVFVGGTAYEADAAMAPHAHVVVGTPGRLLHLGSTGALPLRKVRMLVLDEADRLVEDGFVATIAEFASLCGGMARQTIALSATYTAEAVRRLKPLLARDAVTVLTSSRDPTLPNVTHEVLEVADGGFRARAEAVVSALAARPFHQCFVFVAARQRVEPLTRFIEQRWVRPL
jgi:superfamily II DNA/RNA helicase